MWQEGWKGVGLSGALCGAGVWGPKRFEGESIRIFDPFIIRHPIHCLAVRNHECDILEQVCEPGEWFSDCSAVTGLVFSLRCRRPEVQAWHFPERRPWPCSAWRHVQACSETGISFLLWEGASQPIQPVLVCSSHGHQLPPEQLHRKSSYLVGGFFYSSCGNNKHIHWLSCRLAFAPFVYSQC